MAFLRPTLMIAAGLVLGGPSHAALIAADPFAGLEPLAPEEMGAARGGMMINGISMDFAIVVRSTVDGAVSQGLQTVLTVNDAGGLASAVTTPIGATAGTTLTTNADGSLSMALPSGTTIVHEVLANQVQAIIANTTSGVTLNQSTAINVDLPGFTAQTQSWYSASHAIQASMDSALRSLGNR